MRTHFIAKKIRAQEFNPRVLGLFTNPAYIARRGLHHAMKTNARHIRGRVLDIGSGTKPYRYLFETAEYVGLELDTPQNRQSKQADVFYDGSRFPFPDNAFDSAISNQVLEHAGDPELFVGEAYRILKPGGIFLLTVPFMWEEHEQPHDYRRFTSFGIVKLLREQGFTILSHQKLSTGLDVTFQTLAEYLRRLAPRQKHLKLLFYIVFIGSVNLMALLARQILPTRKELFLDNLVIAKKNMI